MGSNKLSDIFWVAVGGAIGATLRHGTQLLLTSQFGDEWIYAATAFVNIVGSFLMGFLFFHIYNQRKPNRKLSLFLLVGVIGSYTTYSGFATQGIILIQDSASLFFLYFFGQIVSGIIAVIAGMKIASKPK